MIETNKEYDKIVGRVFKELDKIKYPKHIYTIKNRIFLNDSVKEFYKIKNSIPKEIANNENLVEKIKKHRTKLDIILFPYLNKHRPLDNNITCSNCENTFKFMENHEKKYILSKHQKCHLGSYYYYFILHINFLYVDKYKDVIFLSDFEYKNVYKNLIVKLFD